MSGTSEQGFVECLISSSIPTVYNAGAAHCDTSCGLCAEGILIRLFHWSEKEEGHLEWHWSNSSGYWSPAQWEVTDGKERINPLSFFASVFSLYLCFSKVPLSWPTIIFVSFLLTPCAEDGSDRAAWWAPGVHPRSSSFLCRTVTPLLLKPGCTDLIQTEKSWQMWVKQM